MKSQHLFNSIENSVELALSLRIRVIRKKMNKTLLTEEKCKQVLADFEKVRYANDTILLCQWYVENFEIIHMAQPGPSDSCKQTLHTLYAESKKLIKGEISQ